MIRAFKYRIYPTSSQERKLLQTTDLCRLLYNCALEERISSYKTKKESVNYNKQAEDLPEIKEDFPEYKNIHSQVLQETLKRLEKSFDNFFRRLKTGEKPGFPRFLGKHRSNSFTYPQSGFKFKKGKLFLSKIGYVKINLHRTIIGEIKTCTIIKSPTGKWFVCFSTCVEKQPLPKTNKVVGIDLGIKKYITTSDNEEIAPQKFLNKHLQRLAKASRRYSKNKTLNKRKTLARIHEKVVNSREHWQHQVANALIKENDIICVEKLNILKLKNSSSHSLNRNINDMSWGKLVHKLLYKAEYADKKVVLVNPVNTSRKCSNCGNIKSDLSLEVRIYRCEPCGMEKDRDFNAAINIKNLGVASLMEATPESRDILFDFKDLKAVR